VQLILSIHEVALQLGPANGIVFVACWLPGYHFFATIFTMKTTIDSAGRIVVPKSLRQALNIKPGQTLDIRAGDGRLEIEIAATPMTLKKRGKDVVAVPDIGLPTLTADAVRETLEHIRR
jgi:AbrB family looped-hinge helix DNA binding protein